MRLEGKTVIIVGGGQAPGASDTIGNGRATALLFAREGAKVCCVDRHLESAQETADAIAAAWEKITDSIGRESQIKLYKASMGL